MESEKIQRGDFVEIKFTGYANGKIFDSNVEEDLKEINSKATPEKTIIAVGERMLVEGLDNALEDKELNKEYEISVSSKEGFGERKKELVRTIPLNSFRAQNVMPQAGMMLALDNAIVKILAVSGARVIADFNNPLAGKDLKYKIKILRKVTDEKEKAEALFSGFFRFVPEFEISQENIIIRGPANLKIFSELFSEKFKTLIGKPLFFELKEKPKEEVKEPLANLVHKEQAP